VVHSRTLAVFVGALSLLLGLWAVLGDLAAMGAAAGAVGFVAGLLALVPDTTAPAPTATADGPPPEPTAILDPAADEPTLAAPGADHPGEHLEDRHTEAESGELLTDPTTDLFSEAYLRVALDSRLASARRHLRPVAVALLEVTEGIPDDLAVPAPPDRVADAIRETVREADIACRMNDGHFAVILEDTPENGAVWTVERIRRNLVSRFGHHTLWAGVACYPAHAFDSAELMSQVRLALETAKEWKQDRIEVAAAE
jgi:two-component system cell cycle response regulator